MQKPQQKQQPIQQHLMDQKVQENIQQQPQHEQKRKLQSPSISSSSQQSVNYAEPKSPQKIEQKKRYKYCCKICKHTDKNKKACVCVVPMNQRRTQIGQGGCQTCACVGCSKEDFISRGQDPQYHPGQKKQVKSDEFEARNGCCRKCMKAFSKNNKACLCQVPQEVRKGKLPSGGCKICSCFGCNPEDKKQAKDRKGKQKNMLVLKSYSKSRSRNKKHKKQKSRRSSSSRSPDIIDPIAMNFYNIERSVIGGMIANDYNLNPCIFGFGVPQRTQSYIIGKPK